MQWCGWGSCQEGPDWLESATSQAAASRHDDDYGTAAQAPDGSVRVAAAAGSALQPQAVVLLAAAGVQALAGSKPGDWQVIEPSAAFKVGRWAAPRGVPRLSARVTSPDPASPAALVAAHAPVLEKHLLHACSPLPALPRSTPAACRRRAHLRPAARRDLLEGV